jgi:hypothetical protein
MTGEYVFLWNLDPDFFEVDIVSGDEPWLDLDYTPVTKDKRQSMQWFPEHKCPGLQKL